MQRWWLAVLLSVLSFGSVEGALAATGPDLMVVPGYVHFVPDTLVSGQRVRMYARVRNVGDVDATAQVLFYVGSQLIGTSQPVSVLAEGGFDDVFVDATVPDGRFNVTVRVGGSSPEEVNTANNEVLTPQFMPLADADRDTVPDATDNCASNPNDMQGDVDGDGLGDACDATDDRVTEVVPVIPIAIPAPVTPPPFVPPASEAPVTAPQHGQSSASDEASEEATVLAPVAAEPSVFASLFAAAPQLSPQARFLYVRQDWRTVAFTLAQRPGELAPVAVAWDFGDGTTSAREEVTHVFTRTGTYRVSLAVTDAFGNVTTDEEMITLSAFHLSNPIVLITVLLLLGLLCFSVLYVVRVRNALRRGL
jgi:hypothetical protein